MGSSSSKKAKEEQEKKEKAAKQKCLDTKALLEEKYKKYEALYNAKFKESKNFEDEARKKLKAGDKIGAKKMLVKKKKLQQQLDVLNNQLAMMDEQIIALESAENLGTITKTIKKANSVLKENKDKIDIEELQAEGDKLKDLKEQNAEYNKVIEDYHNENVDDDELEEELEKCEKELENDIKLPSSNKENLNDKEKNKKKEKELNKIS